jgi:hypothetical protein
VRASVLSRHRMMSTATDLNSQAPQSIRGQRATQHRDDDVDDYVGTLPPLMP